VLFAAQTSQDHRDMLEYGLLRHLISDHYTRDSLQRIKVVLAVHHSHQILPVANGLFAASPSQEADSLTGYQNVWVRDNVMVANSFRLRSELAPAIACVQGLTRFFVTQLPRFREIIHDPIGLLKEDVNRRPHVRFLAPNLGDSPETWPHAQNDALGQALWLRFVLAKTGALPFTADDAEVYGVFPAYFAAIRYWRDSDSGAWEEGRKINNSSVGAVVAGLEEVLTYKERTRSDVGVDLPLAPLTPENLRELIAEGRKRLADTLPFESPPERKVDSALLFLIHPLDMLRSPQREDAILNLVQARLKGKVGIKRYPGDSYFCQDYDEWFPPGEMSSDFSERLDFRDAHLQTDCEAQWCIFDPLLSVIYGQRYLKDRSDTRSFQKQVHYFNRSLAQVSPTGACPELYFLKHRSYIPNAHTPLAWTQANQALALHLMEQSVGENR
jgi:Glycosyl hydrolases family 15